MVATEHQGEHRGSMWNPGQTGRTYKCLFFFFFFIFSGIKCDIFSVSVAGKLFSQDLLILEFGLTDGDPALPTS